jgi:hypothetical protein
MLKNRKKDSLVLMVENSGLGNWGLGYFINQPLDFLFRFTDRYFVPEKGTKLVRCFLSI